MKTRVPKTLPKVNVNISSDACKAGETLFSVGKKAYLRVQRDGFSIVISTLRTKRLYRINLEGFKGEFDDITINVIDSDASIHLKDVTCDHITIAGDQSLSVLGNLSCLHGTIRAMTVRYGLTCTALNISIYAAQLYLKGQMTVSNNAVMYAGTVYYNNDNDYIKSLTIYSDNLIKFGAASKVVGNNINIYGKTCYVLGLFSVNYVSLYLKNILYLSDSSKIKGKGFLYFETSILELNGVILHGTMKVASANSVKFGLRSYTKLIINNIQSDVIEINGRHRYVTYNIYGQSSLELGSNTSIRSSNYTESYLSSTVANLDGNIEGWVKVYGINVENKCKISNSSKILIIGKESLNNLIESSTDATDVEMAAGKLFIDGNHHAENQFMASSSESTYIKISANISAAEIKTQGKGNAVIAGKLNSGNNIIISYQGVVCTERSAKFQCKNIIALKSSYQIIDGYFKGRKVEFFAVQMLRIEQTAKFYKRTYINIRAGKYYEFNAKVSRNKLKMIAPAGQICKPAYIDAKKAIFAGDSLLIKGHAEADVLKGYFSEAINVTQDGELTLGNQTRLLTVDFHVEGKLNQSLYAEGSTVIKSETFTDTANSVRELLIPTQILTAAATMNGHSKLTNTIMKVNDLTIGGDVSDYIEEGSLKIIGDEDKDTVVRINKHADVAIADLQLHKIKGLRVGGKVGSRKILIDAKDTSILPTGELGQAKSELNVKGDTVHHYGTVRAAAANFALEKSYIQNRFKGPAASYIKTLKLTAPKYINILGYINAPRAVINSLISMDFSLNIANLTMHNSLLNINSNLLGILINMLGRLGNISKISDKLIKIINTLININLFAGVINDIITNGFKFDRTYFQFIIQPSITLLRQFYPLVASSINVSVNSYLLYNNLVVIKTHKYMRGEALTNAEYVEFLLLIKNSMLNAYAVGYEVYSNYDDIKNVVEEASCDISKYFREHFIKDLVDIPAHVKHTLKTEWIDFKRYINRLVHQGPKPISVIDYTGNDGKHHKLSTYNKSDKNEVLAYHPDCNQIPDITYSHIQPISPSVTVSYKKYPHLYSPTNAIPDNTTNISHTGMIYNNGGNICVDEIYTNYRELVFQFFSSNWNYVSSNVALLKSDVKASYEDWKQHPWDNTKKYSFRVYQSTLPFVLPFLPARINHGLVNIDLFNFILTGNNSQAGLINISLYSVGSSLYDSKQGIFTIDISNNLYYTPSANYSGYYAYIGKEGYIPILNISTRIFKQPKDANMQAYFTNLDIPEMKKYNIDSEYYNFTYDHVDDEQGFLRLKPYKHYGHAKGAAFKTNHKIDISQNFITPWDTTISTSEIDVKRGVLMKAPKLGLVSTKGSLAVAGKLKADDIYEISEGKIIHNHSTVVAKNSLVQHARLGISLQGSHLQTDIGLLATDHGDISNNQSSVKFKTRGAVDATRGNVVMNSTTHAKAAFTSDKEALFVHAGDHLIDHAGVISAGGDCIVSFDEGMTGTAIVRTHHKHRSFLKIHGLSCHAGTEVTDELVRPTFASKNGIVALSSQYGTANVTSGAYSGNKGIYFDFRDAPAFNATNVHSVRRDLNQALPIFPGGMPFSYKRSVTDEMIGQQFNTNGSIVFRVKHGDLVLPDSSIKTPLLVTEIWNGDCSFPQTPIKHDETGFSLGLKFHLGGFHLLDENQFISFYDPVIDDVNNIRSATNNIDRSAGLWNVLQSIKNAPQRLCDPDIGFTLSIRGTRHRYTSPNHTQFVIGKWINYSNHIDIGDVSGVVGELQVYKGTKLALHGQCYESDYTAITRDLDISYHLVSGTSSGSESYNSIRQSGHYWHNSQLRINHAEFYQPVDITLDQATLSFGTINGKINHINLISHKGDMSTQQYSFSRSSNDSCGFAYNQATSNPVYQSEFHLDNADGVNIVYISNKGGLLRGQGMKAIKPRHISQTDMTSVEHHHGFSLAFNRKLQEVVSIGYTNNSIRTTVYADSSKKSSSDGHVFLLRSPMTLFNEGSKLAGRFLPIRMSNANQAQSGKPDTEKVAVLNINEIEEPVNDDKIITIQENKRGHVKSQVLSKQSGLVNKNDEASNERKKTNNDNLSTENCDVDAERGDCHNKHHIHLEPTERAELEEMFAFLKSSNHPLFAEKIVVYRGDSRDINTIRDQGGFKPRGNNLDIMSHLNISADAGTLDSGFVSSSIKAEVAGLFPALKIQNGVYVTCVYKFRAPSGSIDVNSYLSEHKLEGFFYEHEIAISKQIPSHKIMGHYLIIRIYKDYELKYSYISDFIPNESYIEKWHEKVPWSNYAFKGLGAAALGYTVIMESKNMYDAACYSYEKNSPHPLCAQIVKSSMALPAAIAAGTQALHYVAPYAARLALKSCPIAAVAVPLGATLIASTLGYNAAAKTADILYDPVLSPVLDPVAKFIGKNTATFFNQMVSAEENRIKHNLPTMRLFPSGY